MLTFGLTGCGNSDTQAENATNNEIGGSDQTTEESQFPPDNDENESVGGGNIGNKPQDDYIIASYLTGFWRAGAADAFLKLPQAVNFQYHGVNIRQYNDMFIVAGYAKRRQHPLNTYTSVNLIERHRGEIVTGMRHFFSKYGISGSPSSLTISGQQDVTIRGMAMTRSTGSFSTPHGQSYFIAYSTIYNGSPIYVIGMAGPNSPNQSTINQTVYDIMLTLRTKR